VRRCSVPSFPDFGRLWQIVDKYQVTHFYTAPTAIRSLMKEGDDWVKKYSRKTLRLLGSVGEVRWGALLLIRVIPGPATLCVW
jgi:acyl-coenzyme A synthetase/AMP-(fatty) acid ligase